MGTYETLKARAAEKRDKAVQAARVEYQRTLRLIEDLAKALPVQADIPRKRRKGRCAGQQPIIELIADVMPKDKAFTIRDIMKGLRLAHPLREFNEPTVRTFFSRLIDQGMIRRLRKADKGFILWVAAGCSIPDDGPLSALSITDATETILKERGPMRPTELVVAIQEQGYRADASPRVLLTSLRQAYKRNGHRFTVLDDGNWASV